MGLVEAPSTLAFIDTGDPAWLSYENERRLAPRIATALAQRDARIGGLEYQLQFQVERGTHADDDREKLRAAIHRLEAAELAALAELDEAKARIGELEDHLNTQSRALDCRADEIDALRDSLAALKPPGTVAVELGYCGVSRYPGCSPSLCKDGTELMMAREELDAVESGDYTATLLLKPAGG